MLIGLCIQAACTCYLSAGKSDVQHMDKLFKRGFPVKTCSGLPILATAFFWSANIKAACDKRPHRGHHFGDTEVLQLLTALILWQKLLATDTAIRKHTAMRSPDCGSEGVRPQLSRLITGYPEGQNWKEKVCFSYWLKISKYSITASPRSLRGSPDRVTEKAVNLSHPWCHSPSWARAQH